MKHPVQSRTPRLAFSSLVFSFLLLSLVMLLAPAAPALAQTNIRNLISVKGTLYFLASGELWKSDGTAGGTMLVKDLVLGSGDSRPDNFTSVDGTLFFTLNNGSSGQTELWKSDGTTAGTGKVKDIPFGLFIGGGKAIGNTLFFMGKTSSGPYELWKSDGTAGGTSSIKKFNHCGSLLSVANGLLYFQAGSTNATGCELWKSDGTATGTTFIKDINPGPGASNPSN
jgi:ELWxxDGT repeat protein